MGIVVPVESFEEHNLLTLPEKYVKKLVAEIAKELGEDKSISMVYGNLENPGENYKILKELLKIEEIDSHNIEILQKIEKDLGPILVEGFLIEVKNGEKKKKLNVTAIFEKNEGEKVLKHVHISETYKINEKGEKEELDNEFKFNQFSKLNLTQKKGRKIDEKDPVKVFEKLIEEVWPKLLKAGADDVISIFSDNAYLKGTVVSHLSLGDKNGVKDYFKHFCELNPEMRMVKKNVKVIGNDLILAYGKYEFTLDDGKGGRKVVPANFTFVLRKNNNKWLIETLHSSLEIKKEDLES